MKNYVLNSRNYTILLESASSTDGGNADDLIALNKIEIDGEVVNTSDFVDVVNTALTIFKTKYPYEYRFMRGATIIYLLDNSITKTMCVDSRQVYYINVGFLYKKAPYGLAMNPVAVFNILYHEAMHAMLEHIPRMISFNEHHKDKKSWTDMNIAGDLEINTMMVADKICTSEFWEIQKGCYDPKVTGLPFESILMNDSVINQQKNVEEDDEPDDDDDDDDVITDGGDDGGDEGGHMKIERIPTSKEWRDGHRYIRKLIRKLYKQNNRDAQKTLDNIEDIMSNETDIKKIVQELEKMLDV